MEILFIVGSLREGSFNRRIADAAAKALENKATVRFLDWKGLPVFNADEIYPFCEQAQIIREAIGIADGIWIFCPEYNSSYPGGLKNLLDFASMSYEKNNYASGSPLKGKPVAQAGAGGRMKTALAQAKLTELLTKCGCKVMTDDITEIAVTPSAFIDNIWQPSAQDVKALEQEADHFLAFIKQNS